MAKTSCAEAGCTDDPPYAELEVLACIAISVAHTREPVVILAFPVFSLVKHPEAGVSLGYPTSKPEDPVMSGH